MKSSLKSRLFTVLFSAAMMTAGFVPQLAHAASVNFVAPADGAVVTSPFDVKFGVTGMEIKPAGDMTPNTGHHHLLINQAPIKAGDAIPADAQHLHFGKGQTDTMVTLPPGKYSLTMQFGDGLHHSYGPEMSKTINVIVQ